jgi:hypothetical protein
MKPISKLSLGVSSIAQLFFLQSCSGLNETILNPDTDNATSSIADNHPSSSFDQLSSSSGIALSSAQGLSSLEKIAYPAPREKRVPSHLKGKIKTI